MLVDDDTKKKKRDTNEERIFDTNYRRKELKKGTTPRRRMDQIKPQQHFPTVIMNDM